MKTDPAQREDTALSAAAPVAAETSVSVIVCAYNADTTMEGCLASFKDVEYPNFEVIVVDDGSTDKTAEISDRYAARYPFIQVIHQPNLGLSAARNVGLHASRGLAFRMMVSAMALFSCTVRRSGYRLPKIPGRSQPSHPPIDVSSL